MTDYERGIRDAANRIEVHAPERFEVHCSRWSFAYADLVRELLAPPTAPTDGECVCKGTGVDPYLSCAPCQSCTGRRA